MKWISIIALYLLVIGDAVSQSKEVAVDTFFVDFEEGIPLDWTIVDVNGGATWVLDNSHGLNGSKCLYNDTYPGSADDWFISPLTRLTDDYVFSICGHGSSQFPDSLAIYVSKTGINGEDFTIEVARFELPGIYTRFNFVLTDHLSLSNGEEVYIGIRSFTEGYYTEIDELRYGEYAFGSILEAFTVSETEIDIIFDGPVGLNSIPVANYELRGSSTITFTTAEVYALEDTILHLRGASENITPDFTIDSILNTVTQEYFKMWAGISPIAYSNILYPGGSLGEIYPATFKAIVMAKNNPVDGQRVWLADCDTAWCGTNAYGGEFYDEVSVGDELILLSVIKSDQNQTELYFPKIMKVTSTGNDLFKPAVIDGSELDKNIAADTNPAEKWEGVLVTVKNATINSFTDHIFYATDDGDTTEFRIGNRLELFYVPLIASHMDIGAVYDITGHVVNHGGDYMIVPRDFSDIVLVTPVSIQPAEEWNLLIRPNPVTDFVRITAPEIISDLKIYHLTGALVKDYQVNRRNVELNISDLPANLYVVKATMRNGKVITEKILKR